MSHVGQKLTSREGPVLCRFADGGPMMAARRTPGAGVRKPSQNRLSRSVRLWAQSGHSSKLWAKLPQRDIQSEVFVESRAIAATGPPPGGP